MTQIDGELNSATTENRLDEYIATRMQAVETVDVEKFVQGGQDSRAILKAEIAKSHTGRGEEEYTAAMLDVLQGRIEMQLSEAGGLISEIESAARESVRNGFTTADAISEFAYKSAVENALNMMDPLLEPIAKVFSTKRTKELYPDGEIPDARVNENSLFYSRLLTSDREGMDEWFGQLEEFYDKLSTLGEEEKKQILREFFQAGSMEEQRTVLGKILNSR